MIISAALFFLLISNASASVLLPRASTSQICDNLHVKSNNGDRKVAIVIDSSGSMAESDPYNLRLAAGQELVNNWLISSKQATSAHKADLVTVINFDSSATLDYPLGDPGAANSSFDQIGADGDTYIAGGVQMAIGQLTQSGSGDTAGRSAILVFTDGEDSDTASLVDQINQAASLGIRVSFGFLDASNGLQDKTVLAAIEDSGGIYNTIVDVASSNQFINLVIVNGLTKNDNPQGSSSTLIAGLSLAHFISGSETQSLVYNAQSGEIVDFTIQSIDAGSLDVQVMFGGRTLNSTTVNDTQSFFSDSEPRDLVIHSPGAGEIDIKVTASDAAADSMFVLGATSNLPVQNCTVKVGGGGGGGNSKKAAAIAAGVIVPIAAIAAIAGALYWWIYKKGRKPAPRAGVQEYPVYAEKPPPPSHSFGPTVSPLPTKPGDPHPSHHPDDNDNPDCSCSEPSDDEENHMQNGAQNSHIKRKRLRHKHRNDDRHHHHLYQQHLCYDIKCPLNDPLHMCRDPNIPCVCEDKKCALNGKEHKCRDDQRRCTCTDKECPVNKEKRKERRRKMAQGVAITAVKAGLSVGISDVTK